MYFLTITQSHIDTTGNLLIALPAKGRVKVSSRHVTTYGVSYVIEISVGGVLDTLP